MTTVIIDPDSDLSVPVKGWVRPTKAETLAKGFPDDPDFVLYEGEPYVKWGTGVRAGVFSTRYKISPNRPNVATWMSRLG